MVLLTYLAVILLGIPFGMLNTVGYRLMWGWFITPVFGVAVPSYWLMYGLLMCVSALFLGLHVAIHSAGCSHKGDSEFDAFKSFFTTAGTTMVLLWTTVLMGYVVHLLV